MEKKRVVIIGGGVIGTACAYYLVKSGWNVTMVEQDEHGKLCSHGNCGLVSPSHVLPLPMPGAVRKSFKLMMQKNSPFYVKPRFDPRLWGWLVRFARRCRHDAMLEAGHARHALLSSSRQLFDELMANESIEAEFQTLGCLFVYRTSERLDGHTKESELINREYGLSVARWDEAELQQKEPALKPGLAGAWYFEADGHLRPDRLMKAWRGVVERLGVIIHENCKFLSFVRRNGRAAAAKTSTGDFEADAFVVATGALTPMLKKHLGCKIPIQPGKGYSITMARPSPCPKYPMLCPEHKLAVTPMQSGYRLGSTMEFSGYDTSLNPKRLNALREAAEHYFGGAPTAEPVEEEWYGWRPMTFDGKPILDRSPIMENVIIAAGHNMLGLSMSPGTGRFVTELLNDEAPHVDPRPYRVSRF